MLFGLDVGEALLESGAGGVVTRDGLEGVLELAAVARQLVGGQGVQGTRGYGWCVMWFSGMRDIC